MTLVLIAQFKQHFITRSQQMAPHMGGVNSTGETVVTVLVVLEFLFHPLSFFLLYVALEGAVRFIGSFVTREIVPSLLVFLFFKISDSMSRSISQRRTDPAVADAVERLPNSRIRIASAAPKPGWNSSVTIGIDALWFEMEREEHGGPPRPYVYVLRPAPPEKILRGYQEYDIARALNATSIREQRLDANVLQHGNDGIRCQWREVAGGGRRLRDWRGEERGRRRTVTELDVSGPRRK